MSYVGVGSTTRFVEYGKEGCTNKKGCVKVEGAATPEQQALNTALRGGAIRTISHSGGQTSVVRDVASGVIDAAYTGPRPDTGLFGGGILMPALIVGGGVLLLVVLKKKKKAK